MGIGDGLRGFPGFDHTVDPALDRFLRQLGQERGGDGREEVLPDSLIAGNGGGGEHGVAPLDILVSGFADGQAAGGLSGIFDAGLDAGGPELRLLGRIEGFAVALATHLHLYPVAAGGELFYFGDFQGGSSFL